jgi:hypothetical protein
VGAAPGGPLDAGLQPFLGTITVDSSRAAVLADWWSAVLGGTVDGFEDYHVWVVRSPRLRGINLAFQQVETPTPGKNRIHLDLGAVDPHATAAALVQRGASVVAEQVAGGVTWLVLADIDGNVFCVSDTGPFTPA